MKRKIIIKLAGLLVLIIFIAVTLSFTTIERKTIACSGINVSFDEDFQFVTGDEIQKEIISKFKGLNGALLDTLNTYELEKVVEENPWVKNAEVFKGYAPSDSVRFKGAIKIHVEQETPVLRIMHGAQGYYMNTEGKHLPFSNSNTANVIVISGNTPDSLMNQKIIPFVEFVNEHEFWKALIQQIHIRNNGELILVPRAGNHKIEFGRADNIETKFRNLKAVYKDGFNRTAGWERYKTVSLKFDNQVVCTLR